MQNRCRCWWASQKVTRASAVRCALLPFCSRWTMVTSRPDARGLYSDSLRCKGFSFVACWLYWDILYQLWNHRCKCCKCFFLGYLHSPGLIPVRPMAMQSPSMITIFNWVQKRLEKSLRYAAALKVKLQMLMDWWVEWIMLTPMWIFGAMQPELFLTLPRCQIYVTTCRELRHLLKFAFGRCVSKSKSVLNLNKSKESIQDDMRQKIWFADWQFHPKLSANSGQVASSEGELTKAADHWRFRLSPNYGWRKWLKWLAQNDFKNIWPKTQRCFFQNGPKCPSCPCKFHVWSQNSFRFPFRPRLWRLRWSQVGEERPLFSSKFQINIPSTSQAKPSRMIDFELETSIDWYISN